MYLLYTLLLTLAIVLTLPYWAWQYATTPKYRGTVRERLGALPPGVVPAPGEERPCLWVHAVSVGETLAVVGLVERLRQTYPHHRVIFSTVTRTGRQVARERMPWLDGVFHLPLDLPGIVARVVDATRPACVVVVETELWPNLFHALERRRIPVLLVNGRLSPRSFGRYHRVRGAMARFLRPVRLFAMQSRADGERMLALGAPAARVTVCGNIKYDQALQLPDEQGMAALRARVGETTAPVWLAASTHPGEEVQVLAIFARLRQRHPSARLILVPRHPERGEEVAALAQAGGWGVDRFSALDAGWETAVLVVDQVGWLTRFYGLARVAYVGGSLIPHGGQNPLEPAAWGLAPIMGPHTVNFSEVVGHLREAGGMIQAADAEGVYQGVERLWEDEAMRREMGARAREVVATHAGAVERTLMAIQQALTV